MSTFEPAVDLLLKREGGYVDHPADRGGPTNMGICQRDFPEEDIRGLTVARACEIYRAHYWHALFEKIPYQVVANKMFDCCAWFGQPKAIRLVQMALRERANGHLVVDGIFGPQTLMAVKLTPASTMLYELRFRAAQHVTALALADRSQVPFLDGWLRRAVR